MIVDENKYTKTADFVHTWGSYFTDEKLQETASKIIRCLFLEITGYLFSALRDETPNYIGSSLVSGAPNMI